MRRAARGRGTVGMEFLVIFVGFVALLLALNARKSVRALQLQLNGLLTRLSRLQDELENLRRQRPQGPAPEAPAPATQVPETPAPAPPADASAPWEMPEPEPRADEPPSEPEAPAPAPLSATAGPTLEERLGTRWAVWVGGLALA